jgi:hypothetical protein
MTYMVGTAHTARITVGWTYLNAPVQCENVFYLFDASDAIFGSPLTVAAAIHTAVVSDLAPATAPEIIYNEIGFEDVRTVPFGGVVLATALTPGTHSYGGSSLPSDVCIAVKKSTATLGRSGRGRWFFPLGNAATLLRPDEIGPAVATLITGALANFQATVEAISGTPQMGIVSYTAAGTPRSAGLFSRITGWSVGDLYVDSQRRRLLGRGR